MPNIRYAEIKITGRKENIEEFIKILNDGSNKFYKHIRKTDSRYIKEDIYTQRLSIICNDGVTNNHRGIINLNPVISTFEKVSKRLSLDIEACFKTSNLDVVECIYVRDGILLNNLLIGGKYYA